MYNNTYKDVSVALPLAWCTQWRFLVSRRTLVWDSVIQTC